MQDYPKPDSGRLVWHWEGAETSVGYDRMGAGPRVLLLPAPSSISTRAEMLPLQKRLAPHYSTIAIDWPGFGTAPRPRVDWTPHAYTAFLRHVLAVLAPAPLAIVAAGHAASYALDCADAAPDAALCLIAPTWRGPLPTVAGGPRPWMRAIVQVSDVPGIGQLLYRLNVNRPMIRMMGKGHVYQDPDWLSGPRLQEKLAVTGAPGARYASLRFVTGGLDLFADRDAFLDSAKHRKAPLEVIYGAATPRRSKAEMAALAALPGVRATELPQGKLAVHEEFPDAVAAAVMAFLDAVAAAR